MSTPFEVLFSGPEGPVADLGRQVENDVFLEAFGNTPETMAAEYEPYDAQSVFVVVRNTDTGEGASVARLLVDGPAGFKSLVDLGGAPWNVTPAQAVALSGKPMKDERTIDLATTGTRKAYRGAVSLALYQSIYQVAVGAGKEHLVGIQDAKVHRGLKRLLPGGFHAFPGLETSEYLGALSLPVWLDFADLGRSLAEKAPTMHKLIVEGVGLEDMVGTPDWAHGIDVMQNTR